MSAQLILTLVTLTCLQYSYGETEVGTKLEQAKALLGQLASKSATLNGKVSHVEGDISNLKCGFGSLKDDVTVLESVKPSMSTMATDSATLQQHNTETTSQLSGLLGAIKEKKERANIVKEFTHPCGHGNWEQVEYLDFRDPGTPCPDVFISDVYSERPYACSMVSQSGLSCDTYTIVVGLKQYSRVCGRITGYQFGQSNAFSAALNLRLRQGINQAYLVGVSLTHGGTLGDPADPATHIWSFPIGVDRRRSGAESFDISRCPCDGGDLPPAFVGEDYFCESAAETSATQFFPNNPLWDGKDCGASSDCCTRLSHPYFVKQLTQPTTDNIDLRLCKRDVSDNVIVELVELYVQ